MSKYIGGRYIGNDPIQFGGGGRVANPGDICPELPEWEAIGRSDFEPVYEGEEIKEKKEKASVSKKSVKEY